MNEALADGRVPSDLAYVGALGIAGETFREIMGGGDDALSLAALVTLSISKAKEAGEVIVRSFDSAGIVSVSPEDLQCLGGPRLVREIARLIAGGAAHG
jgi:hypothetical protein